MEEGRWLLLMHQIPPQPNYLRVKIWRRLQRLGAVAIKNTVYVLPKSEQAQEDFEWLAQEIVSDGGDASICEARFVHGLSDDQIERMFIGARDADYAQLAEAAQAVKAGLPRRGELGEGARASLETELVRLRRRCADISAIDFFHALGRETVTGLLAQLETKLTTTATPPEPATEPRLELGALSGRTWVTRKGIHVDRMASAWLIRRFIDPKARFKFVPAKGYRPQPGELRFDMFAAEFTHQGDRCTFEVLLERTHSQDRALRAIGEIVHDIDLKDDKFGRQEAAGVSSLIAGIAMAHKEDEPRLDRGAAVFENLYAYFSRKRADREGS